VRKAFWAATAWAAVAVAASSPVEAESETPCTRVTRANVVQCALRASLQVRAEQQSVEALQGRRVTASALFNSNPVVSLTGGKHSVSGDQGYTWFASLSQELEVAGQVGTRRGAVDAQLDAQRSRVTLSERDVTVAAWTAYFEVIATQEELRLSERLGTLARALATTARARSEKGLIAPVESDVAEASATRLNQMRLASERRAGRANAVLAWMMGADPTASIPSVDGELTPLPFSNSARAKAPTAPADRPEVQVADAERRALELRASTFRRSRVPNPSVSVFAQNDPFEGRIIGLGLAFPLPIPGWSRTFGGEVAESDALARRAAIEAERARRDVRLEVVTALQAYESRSREVETFSVEQIRSADKSLQALGEEVQAGRLGVRDAIITQQALIDLLHSHLEARKALCLASVEILRALGIPLERGTP
jgi:outer membrane protein, heavy metal efflux system